MTQIVPSPLTLAPLPLWMRLNFEPWLISGADPIAERLRRLGSDRNGSEISDA